MKLFQLAYMRSFPLLLLLVFLVPEHSVAQKAALKGKWIRLPKDSALTGQIRKFGFCGDLELKKDHRFLILGDAAASKSTTSGWAVCEQQQGPWELYKGNLLTLWLDDRTSNVYLRYRIIKLNNKELVLRSVLSDTPEFDLYFIKAD